MAFKKSGNKTLKIVCATSLCIFSLLSVFVGAWAWFMAKRSVGVSNDDFAINNIGDVVSSVEFHTLNQEKEIGGVNYYLFNKTPASTVTIQEGEASQTGSISLGTYSSLDPHHPVLMLFELKGSNVSISLQTDSFYITDGVELAATNNPLSSVVEFYSFTYSSTTSDPTSLSSRTKTVDGTQYYSLGTSEFVSGQNNSSFVDINNGEFTGTFNSEVSVFEGSTIGKEYIGIVVDYYAESLEYIFSHYMGNSLLDNEITFACDWEMNL